MGRLDRNKGLSAWAADARAYEFGDWSYLRDRSGNTVGVSDGGLYQIHPDGQGRTEWFTDVLRNDVTGNQ